MMNIYRIWGVMYRHLLLNFRNILRITDLFYWPLFDLLIWGFVGQWIQADAGSGSYTAQLVIAIILWHMTLRPVMEINFGALEEMWSHNVFNVTTTSLQLSEWMTALITLGIIKAAVLLTVGSVCVWFMFGVNVFMLGLYLIPFVVLLLLSGCTLGLFASAFIVRWGQAVEGLAWTVPWLFAPLSAVFVPLSVLPSSFATIVKLSPITYVFEAMRGVVSGKMFPIHYLWLSLGLNLVYLCLAFCFFVFMLNKSRARGLARL